MRRRLIALALAIPVAPAMAAGMNYNASSLAGSLEGAPWTLRAAELAVTDVKAAGGKPGKPAPPAFRQFTLRLHGFSQNRNSTLTLILREAAGAKPDGKEYLRDPAKGAPRGTSSGLLVVAAQVEGSRTKSQSNALDTRVAFGARKGQAIDVNLRINAGELKLRLDGRCQAKLL